MANDNKDIFAPGQNKMRLDDQKGKLFGRRRRGEILNNVLPPPPTFLPPPPQFEDRRNESKLHGRERQGCHRARDIGRLSIVWILTVLSIIYADWQLWQSGSSVISGVETGEGGDGEAANRISSHRHLLRSPKSRKR